MYYNFRSYIQVRIETNQMMEMQIRKGHASRNDNKQMLSFSLHTVEVIYTEIAYSELPHIKTSSFMVSECPLDERSSTLTASDAGPSLTFSCLLRATSRKRRDSTRRRRN